MAGNDSGEKTEDPTPKKIRDSRKEGQIPRTNDLGGWLGILALTVLAPYGIEAMFERLGASFVRLNDIESDVLGMQTILMELFFQATVIAAPAVLLLGLINVAAQFLQVQWTPKKLKFNWKKLNPISGIKNTFKPTRIAWETVKNILKLLAVIIVCWGPTLDLIDLILGVGAGSGAKVLFVEIGLAVLRLLRTMVLVGLCIAAVDYFVSRKQIRDQIKMTKQEVKEEYKQQEGDPHVKGQRRQRQMAMSRNRMMAATADATAVIANPTHYSVALKYDPMSGAPSVVAKGQGPLALKIREVARENNIPIIHDIPLARTLYRVVEVDEQIPKELYEAIAQVLAWVWSMKARGRNSEWMESPYAKEHEDLLRYKRKRVRQERGEVKQAFVEIAD